MSEDYKPKRAITIIRPNEVGPNQEGLLVHVPGIPEYTLVLRSDGNEYASKDGARWYAALPNDVIEILL